MKTVLLLLFAMCARAQTDAESSSTRPRVASAVSRSQQSKNDDVMSIRDFGARGDTFTAGDGIMTAGSTTFHSPSTTFDSASIGMAIGVGGAGAPNARGYPAALNSVILSVIDAHHVTLTNAAANNSAGFFWLGGTDDTAPIQTALNWACAHGSPTSRHLQIPFGTFRITRRLTCAQGVEGVPLNAVSIMGGGAGSIILNAGSTNGALSVETPSTSGFQETAFSMHHVHFLNATSGIADYALRLYDQNGFDISGIVIDGQDGLIDGIRLEASQMGSISGSYIRGAQRGYNLQSGIIAGYGPNNNESVDIGGGFVHFCTGYRSNLSETSAAPGANMFHPASLTGIRAGLSVWIYGSNGNAHVPVTAVGQGNFSVTLPAALAGPLYVASDGVSSAPGSAGVLLESASTTKIHGLHVTGCAVSIQVEGQGLAKLGDSVQTVEIANNFLEESVFGAIRGNDTVRQSFVRIHDNVLVAPQGTNFFYIDGSGFDIQHNWLTGTGEAWLGPNIEGTTIANNHMYGNPVGPGLRPLAATATANTPVKSGPAVYTLTPSSMAGMFAGRDITVSSEDGTNSENTVILSATPTTIKVPLSTPKTGPVFRITAEISKTLKIGENANVTNYVGGRDQVLPDLRTHTMRGQIFDSPQTTPGPVVTVNAPSAVAGNWGINGAGAGGADGRNNFFLQMGTGRPTDPVLAGDMNGSRLKFCNGVAAYSDPMCTGSDLLAFFTSGLFQVNAPLQLKSQQASLAHAAPVIAANIDHAGAIVEPANDAWQIAFNQGSQAPTPGHNLCIEHFSGTIIALGMPACWDATGNTILQRPLALAYGGTGAASAEAARTNLGVDPAPSIAGVTLTLAKLTPKGKNGSITIGNTGRITSYTPPR